MTADFVEEDDRAPVHQMLHLGLPSVQSRDYPNRKFARAAYVLSVILGTFLTRL